MQLLRVHIPENVLSPSPKFSWSGLRSCLVMTWLAKHVPLENLRSCDRSMQSPSRPVMCRWVPCRWCVLGCFQQLVLAAVCLHVIYTNKIKWSANTRMACGKTRGWQSFQPGFEPQQDPKEFWTKIYIFQMSLIHHYYIYPCQSGSGLASVTFGPAPRDVGSERR